MKRFISFLSVVLASCVGLAAPAVAAQPTTHPAVVSVRSIEAAPLVRSAITVDSTAAAASRHMNPSQLLMLMGFALIGAVKTIAADKDSNVQRDSLRQQFNKHVADFTYFMLHRPAWQVAAAAVAPPVLNIGTTTSKVKTTATTQLLLNGVVKSLTATDDLFVLTGGNLAAGSVRRYLMCWDGTSATTVVSVIASNDQVIASFASAAAALLACVFPTLPPAGTGIVGIVSITNVTNAFTPGTTALTATGVTTAYLDGLDDSVFLAAQVTP